MRLKNFALFLFFLVPLANIGFSQNNMAIYDEKYSLEHFKDEISDTKALLEKDLLHCRNKAANIYLRANAIFERTKIVDYKEVALEAAFLYAVTFAKDLKVHTAHSLYEIIRGEALKYGFYRIVALVSNAFGASFFGLEYYDLAAKEFNIALKTAEYINDSIIQAIAIGNMGILMLSVEKYDSANYYSALEYFNKSLLFNSSNDRVSGRIVSYTNIAITYLELNKYEEAEENFLNAISLAEENEMIRLACTSYMHMAELKKKNLEFNKSIEFARIAIKTAKEVDRLDVLHGSYTILAEVYDSLENNDSAYYYAIKSIEIGELLSISDHEFQKAEVLSAERFRNENKQLEIEKIYQNQIITKSKTQSIYLLLVIILVIIVLIILFISHRNRVRINNLLNEKNEDLNSTVIDLRFSENQLKLANSAKDKFIGILSHDIMTPISSINNLTEGMVDSFEIYDMDSLYSMLKNLNNEASGLKRFIRAILQWVSYHEKKVSFKPMQMNLVEVVYSTISLLEQFAQKKEVEIINKLEEEVFVFADPEMISAVIRNLLVNAIKFSDNKSKVELYVVEDKHKVTLCIKDYGIGIGEDDVKKLFKIETDNKVVGKSKSKGSGLGLLLCKEIISINHGEISVESKLGQGSIFSFTLNKRKWQDEEQNKGIYS
ncbi:MAG: hypothetical protein C0592_12715 [Marinilabiliales bacterium]|nr:MAG: hypothetical protein C0592_12715 [Marinilabiliales bacterium]